MGLAAGINGMFALHVLGVLRGASARELKRFVPVMWGGFWVNAVSGVLLLIAYPTKALTNPVFYLKLSLIAGGLFVFTRIKRLFLDPAPGASVAPSTARWLAVASLTCWASAIFAGRLLAYTYTRLTASW